MPMPGHVSIACLSEDGHEIETAIKDDAVSVIVVDEKRHDDIPAAPGKPVAVRVRVTDQDAVLRGVALLEHADIVLVELADETNIPLELLLAEAQSSRASVVKQVASIEDARIALGILESGAQGLMFPIERIDQVAPLSHQLRAAAETHLDLVEATVLSSNHAGMGHRGCVDTASLFAKDEGMLVGSTSQGGILVCAEVHYLPYMNLRPFRVNAGAVHSYVWTPGGRTAYITDLAVGESVLAVDTAGRARPTLVGRVKTEVRPLRLIVVEAGGTKLNVLLQDDWHVRVFDADGGVRNVSTIARGDRLLAYVDDPGRHVGIKVDETIEEW
jgi:3-dehydroquinate synthase II/3-amino-4-hydroxybenzoic acid synthase